MMQQIQKNIKHGSKSEPKSIQNPSTNRCGNLNDFWIDFWADSGFCGWILGPLRLPSKVLTGANSALNNTQLQKRWSAEVKCEGDVRRVFTNPNTPAARGVNPRPGADLGCLRQYSRSGPRGSWVHLKRNAHTVICKGFSVLGAEYQFLTKINVFQHWINEPTWVSENLSSRGNS